MLEPQIDEAIRDLAQKKGITASGFIRQLILSELKFHGLLPPELAYDLLRDKR